MNRLHPNAKIIFYIHWLLGLVFIGALFVTPIAIVLIADNILNIFLALPIIIGMLAAILILPIPIAHLVYENYKYQLQENRVYIEKGIIWKRYVTIPYERVQNVDIIRGPLARSLELSDLQIQTAGAHSTYAMVSEGRIPGIDPREADRLRDEILSKIDTTKNQGL